MIKPKTYTNIANAGLHVRKGGSFCGVTNALPLYSNHSNQMLLLGKPAYKETLY